VAADIAFDWDNENRDHLKRHKVTPQEFEHVMFSGPVELEYQEEGGEERYKSLGITNQGRILVALWTVRDDRIRPITAYPAPAHLRRLWQELLEREAR